jgi:hypothetical protein
MMDAVAESTRSGTGRRRQDRLVAGFLFALMAVGCLVTWIGVPIACMWFAGELTEEPGTHFLIALPATVLLIIVCVSGLFWINRLYLRVTLGPSLGADDEEEDDEERRWMRGPLEPMLVGSLMIALVAIFIWFFFIAENPSRQVI